MPTARTSRANGTTYSARSENATRRFTRPVFPGSPPACGSARASIASSRWRTRFGVSRTSSLRHNFQQVIHAPNLSDLPWIVHGFGLRDSTYPEGIRFAKQIHSDIVLNAARVSSGPCEGDALITNEPGVLNGVKTT